MTACGSGVGREYSRLASKFDPLADVPLRVWQQEWAPSRKALQTPLRACSAACSRRPKHSVRPDSTTRRRYHQLMSVTGEGATMSADVVYEITRYGVAEDDEVLIERAQIVRTNGSHSWSFGDSAPQVISDVASVIRAESALHEVRAI